MTWVRQLRFAQPAQDAAPLDYLSERIKRLGEAIREAVQQAPPEMQAVVQGLQALRGIGLISAVTIACEIGSVSRFQNARQLMSYSGTVLSENSSGKRTQRGAITKSGNPHLRRILGEAAWSHRRQPAVGPALRKRQEGVPEEIRQMAWKAQGRLSKRYADWQPRARIRGRSSRRRDANCWGLSGQSACTRKHRLGRPSRPEKQKQRQKQKLSKE